MKILFLLSLILSTYAYDRFGAVNYAKRFAKIPNHRCGKYDDCTPCSYWGSEACGYSSHGGDCANFVSQCLVKGGGHPPLNTGGNCRGYPCGFEEVGAQKLGLCLKSKGWVSTCGYQLDPPSNIQQGDVIIYHRGGCSSGDAHAALITIGGTGARITCHSNIQVDTLYTYMAGSKPYYEWLHYNN